MIVPLSEAEAATCGGKAAALGALLRAGLPVPGGFVLPFAAYRAAAGDLDPGRLTGEPGDPARVRQAIAARPLPGALIGALERALAEIGDVPVAVRSSASGEDTGRASAAGQHESFLAVRGADEVAGAVRACWASLVSPRAVAYRNAPGHDGGPGGDPLMAVIVQRHLDAEVSGVMFTPSAPGGETEIEASWGLGPSVVGGTVTPDSYRVAGDGTVARTVADKRTRLDRRGGRLAVLDVPAPDRERPALDDAAAVRLARLGGEVAAALGGPQDVEWAIAGGRIWLLQARPITAALPRRPARDAAPGASATASDTPATATGVANTAPGVSSTAPDAPAVALSGTPGSHGTATGAARIVRGPRDFGRVRPGDILVCPFTDPAWTPLLRIAAGVVTETGGVLSHAAIVARERAIPAVLGVPDATGRLRDGALITIDGTTGTVTAATP
ncbi:PEP/pyruvate-binding domain-containing protein [Bailinhaonella thermotolerans]|uniref:Pyruvate, phosphate dikinase n=1 Tax=Bailinhaonella thermotolerans TaxID=1070861 RepID=A0A3A4A7I0_9ACTN|nr:PEP/pyruvate-binding domain-containing protein [Bailinhaonella thermotolerans]RJL22957.1 pyruvate, phosphate dikinase [Bailinhaonella thermotolerans]